MSTKLTYTRKGDYLFPNLTVDKDENEEPIGKYGLMRWNYLKENERWLFDSMQLQDTLIDHIRDIDRTANERMEVLMRELLKKYPAPDKATDQLGWVAHMNNLKAMAEENVLNELIYC